MDNKKHDNWQVYPPHHQKSILAKTGKCWSTLAEGLCEPDPKEERSIVVDYCWSDWRHICYIYWHTVFKWLLHSLYKRRGTLGVLVCSEQFSGVMDCSKQRARDDGHESEVFAHWVDVNVLYCVFSPVFLAQIRVNICPKLFERVVNEDLFKRRPPDKETKWSMKKKNKYRLCRLHRALHLLSCLPVLVTQSQCMLAGELKGYVGVVGFDGSKLPMALRKF